MKKIKVITVVGTRPEIIRLSKVISHLDKNVNHIFVHTGQNYDYELNKIFFKDLNLRLPNYQVSLKKESSISNINQIMLEVDKILKIEKPDAFVVLGDTNSCLSAYCAKRRKIPIFHIEAGNRCYDERVPEEINRKIIDHISDVNITYSEIARQNLIRENIHPDKVFKVGSPLSEVFKFYKKNIFKSNILKKYKLTKKNYFLISVHREENLDNDINFKKFINLLRFLSENFNNKIIVSTHPRTMKKIDNLPIKNFKKIIFTKPFAYTDYIKLQMNAKIVMSDSGSITEEVSIINFPAINLRSTNERQEGMNFGIVPMIHFDQTKIKSIIDTVKPVNKKITVTDYECTNFSKVFYNILISYIDYVKEYTWKSKN